MDQPRVVHTPLQGEAHSTAWQATRALLLLQQIENRLLGYDAESSWPGAWNTPYSWAALRSSFNFHMLHFKQHDLSCLAGSMRSQHAPQALDSLLPSTHSSLAESIRRQGAEAAPWLCADTLGFLRLLVEIMAVRAPALWHVAFTQLCFDRARF